MKHTATVLLSLALSALCSCSGKKEDVRLPDSLYGRYELSRIDGGSIDSGISEAEVSEMKDYDLNCTLDIRTDGTVVLDIYGEEEQYTLNGYSFTNPETEETITFEADDSTLTIQDQSTSQALIFVRSGESGND
jgi:hypothetical protein